MVPIGHGMSSVWNPRFADFRNSARTSIDLGFRSASRPKGAMCFRANLRYRRLKACMGNGRVWVSRSHRLRGLASYISLPRYPPAQSLPWRKKFLCSRTYGISALSKTSSVDPKTAEKKLFL